jgi:hypothetical protein
MSDLIEGREVTPEKVAVMTNCRLRKTFDRLQQLLAMVEVEMEGRIGRGGGGLK